MQSAYLIPPESDDGNVEYKRTLSDASNDKLIHVASQLRYRLAEYDGYECTYLLGVDDDGTTNGLLDDDLEASKEMLVAAAHLCGCIVHEIVKTRVSENKSFAEYLVRKNNTSFPMNVKVVVAGSVDAGKSSTIGCLVNAVLDDGKGLARSKVANFVHELKSGRTSSIAQHILGFDQHAQPVTVGHGHLQKSWSEVCSESTKIITFFDLAGHEAYIRTTIKGIQQSRPDFALVMVAANKGFTNITLQHLHLLVCLEIPFGIVMTKLDLVQSNAHILKQTMTSIKKLLKRPVIRRVPLIVRNIDDILTGIKGSANICCIFKVSNVTGGGQDLLRTFLNLVPSSNNVSDNYGDDVTTQMLVESDFSVVGVGTVLGGQLVSGKINVGDTMFLGPDKITGEFTKTTVKSIHVKRRPVQHVSAGSYVCIATRGIKREAVGKHKLLVSRPVDTYKRITTRLKINNSKHSTNVRLGFQPVLFINHVRTTATLIGIANKSKYVVDSNVTVHTQNTYLHAGESADVTFEFVNNYVWCQIADHIVFYNGAIKAHGIIHAVESNQHAASPAAAAT